MGIINFVNSIFDKLRVFDFLAPLFLRLFLAPILMLAGWNKLSNISGIAQWFDSLGFPMPTLLAYLAGGTEFIGGLMLLIGFGVRWAAVPLMFVMIVAASTHWDNGWHALPDKTLTVPWEWRKDLIDDAEVRKSKAKEILRANSNYRWITSAGSITILKNGVEFAATYFIMLLALFYLGSGKYLGVDYYLSRFARDE